MLFRIGLLLTCFMAVGCASKMPDISSPGTPKEVKNPSGTLNSEVPKTEPYTDAIKKVFSVVASNGNGRDAVNITYTFGVGQRGGYIIHCNKGVLSSKATTVLARISFNDSYVDVATYRPIAKMDNLSWDQCMNYRGAITQANKTAPVTIDVKSSSEFALITVGNNPKSSSNSMNQGNFR